MSKADEMFKELGYKKYINDSKTKIRYIFEGADNIIFDLEIETVKAYIWNDGTRELVKSLNKEELQAINEKVKELGWYE